MSMPLIDIRFYLDKEIYTSRGWYLVPRTGDEVMLGSSVKEKKPYRVIRVVWGCEGDINVAGIQAVNVEIERIE